MDRVSEIPRESKATPPFPLRPYHALIGKEWGAPRNDTELMTGKLWEGIDHVA